MTQETLIIALAPAGWALWGLGGRGVMGTKTWRRELWPLWCAGWAFAAIGDWRYAFTGFVVGDAVHRMPYGESTSWGMRGVTALCLGLWTMGFMAPLWAALWVSGWFFSHLWLSRRFNQYTWRWVETSTGLWQGVAITLGLS